MKSDTLGKAMRNGRDTGCKRHAKRMANALIKASRAEGSHFTSKTRRAALRACTIFCAVYK